MTTLTLSDKDAGSIKAQALILLSAPATEGAALLPAHGVADETVEHVDATLAAISATGRPEEYVTLTGVPGVSTSIVVVAGTGLDTEADVTDLEAVRLAVGGAVRKRAGSESVVVAAPGDSAELAGAAAQGALFGAYAFTGYRSGGGSQPVQKVTIVSSAARTGAARAEGKRAETLADAQNFARDLVNTPPNDLYPASFADQVKKRFAGSKVKVSVMDEKALAKADCGGLIGVGRGSSRPPRLVTLSYKPAGAKAHIALVGKGITFDSGGLCLKPGASMVTMKCDMAGAAAVAAAVEAIAALGVKVAVTGYLCLAENMTGSDAQRPGDVVTMHNGKTVEIINTDAEGRLVMADGLSFAAEVEPDVVVDIATLTGAAVMALGGRTTAVLSNDDELAAAMTAAAGRVGEQQWQIPLLEHLRPGMDSDIADVKHTGEKSGGMITAALFLREFITTAKGAELPWLHLDIAGPAFNEGSPIGYHPKGATGHGVRSLVGYVESHA